LLSSLLSGPRCELFQLCESPLQIGFLDHAQLQVHQGRETGRDPWVKLAGVDLCDQPGNRVPYGQHIVQSRQRIQVFAGGGALAPAADPAQFGSLVGIGVQSPPAVAAARQGLPLLARALQRKSEFFRTIFLFFFFEPLAVVLGQPGLVYFEQSFYLSIVLLNALVELRSAILGGHRLDPDYSA
jgi:hypothetical protein